MGNTLKDRNMSNVKSILWEVTKEVGIYFLIFLIGYLSGVANVVGAYKQDPQRFIELMNK